MDALNQPICVCNDFLIGKYDMEEFQYRIERVFFPDMCKNTLEREQHNACNHLEEIIYCHGKSEKQLADIVATELIQATLAEQERLKNYRPY